MGISFNGIDLLLEDGDGRFSDFVDEIIPWEDIRCIAEWPGGVWNTIVNPNVSQTNWSRQIRPKINTWYSPTGASRWGFGFFLADGARKAQLVATGQVASSGSGSITPGPAGAGNAGGGGTGTVLAPLLLVDRSNPNAPLGRAIMACLLPPHPVSAQNSSNSSLWILPIVDLRYFWQFNLASNGYGLVSPIVTAPAFNSWDNQFQGMIANLLAAANPGTAGNFTLRGALEGDFQMPANWPPVSSYLNPDQWEFSRLASLNAAVALDILLASVGCRFVPRDMTLFGGYNQTGIPMFAVEDYLTALTTLSIRNGGSEALGALQVGILNPSAGDLQAVNPAQVNVYFRAYANGGTFADEMSGHQVVSVTAGQAGFSGIQVNAAYVKNIRSTARCYIAAGGGGPGNIGNQNNQTAIANLATQVAKDFYGWQSWFQDQTFPGISRQLHCGFDDYWEFSHERLADGRRVGRSRVHSFPHNCYCDDLLHWDSGLYTWTSPDTLRTYSSRTWEYGRWVFGLLDANLTALGSQTIAVTVADKKIPTDTVSGVGTNHLIVKEIGNANYSSGGGVFAETDGDGNWAIVPAASVTTGGGGAIKGQFAAVVLNGNSATFTPNDGTGGTLTAVVLGGICLPLKDYLVSKDSANSTYYVIDPDKTFYARLPGSANLIVAPATATLEIMSGTIGSETATGVTVAGVEVRTGAVISYSIDTTAVYMVAVTTGGYEVVNPELALQGVVRATTIAGTTAVSVSVLVYVGGSSTGVTVTAQLVRGCCLGESVGAPGGASYEIRWVQAASSTFTWRVVNPTMRVNVTNNTGGNILQGNSGSVQLNNANAGDTITVFARFGRFVNNGIGQAFYEDGNTGTFGQWTVDCPTQQ